MKFALFEFCEDNSCAVGESKWMVDQDEPSFNNKDWVPNKEVLVRWPKSPKDYLKWSNKNGRYPIDTGSETKTYVAKVLKFNDNYDSAREIMTTYMETGTTLTPIRGRGKRTSKKNERYVAEFDNEEISMVGNPSKKIKTKAISNSSVSESHIQLLKEKIAKGKQSKNYFSASSDESEEEQSDSDCEINKMRTQLDDKDKEIEKLKREIRNMKDMQKLQDIVLDLKDSVRSLNKLAVGGSVRKLESTTKNKSLEGMPNKSIKRCPLSPIVNTMKDTSLDSPTLSNPVDNPDNVTLCPNVEISKAQRKILNDKHTAKEFAYSIMPMLWSREVLCTHSVSGRQSNAHRGLDAKPQLDAVKVSNICSYALQKFGCTTKEIRKHMASKMNNILKCCKLQKM